jgi:hypothetical protein
VVGVALSALRVDGLARLRRLEVGDVVASNGFTEIRAETTRGARAAFPNRCLAMPARDALGRLFTDEQFAEVVAARGRPAWSPARLVLVLGLGFVEA